MDDRRDTVVERRSNPLPWIIGGILLLLLLLLLFSGALFGDNENDTNVVPNGGTDVELNTGNDGGAGTTDGTGGTGTTDGTGGTGTTDGTGGTGTTDGGTDTTQ